MVGNKIDREEERQVSTEEGQNFANERNYIFYETSTLTGVNVNECMNTLIQRIYDSDDQKKIINLNSINKRPKKVGCLK